MNLSPLQAQLLHHVVTAATGRRPPHPASGLLRGPDDPVHDPRDPAYMLPGQQRAQAQRNRQRQRRVAPMAPSYARNPLSQVPVRRG